MHSPSALHRIPKSTSKDPCFTAGVSPTPGRQRTAQACDKCRERKTKCSGERPVCQRCTSRGLICEYSYREPRVRGPTRPRMLCVSAPPSYRDSSTKACLSRPTSYRELDYPWVHVPRMDRADEYYGMNNYVVGCLPPGHHPLPVASFATEQKVNSELRGTHLPHWVDVRHARTFASSPGMMHDPICLGYDPYQPLQQSPKRHGPSLGNVSVSSGFLFEVQETSQYNGGHSNYEYGICAIASERKPSSPSDSRTSCHHSGGATPNSPAPTLSCYPPDPPGNPSLNKHNIVMGSSYHGYKKPGFEEDNLLDGDREVTIKSDWCIDLDNKVLAGVSNEVGEGSSEQQVEGLFGTLWQNSVQSVGLEVDFPHQMHTDSVPCT